MPILTTEQNERITQEITCETRRQFERAGFTAQKIARELSLIAFSDIADFVQIDAQGSVKPLPFEELKRNKSRIIRKIREKRRILNGKEDDAILEDTFEFELHDKLKALDLAVEIIGIKKPKQIQFPDKDGNPQDISFNALTDTERAVRLAFLIRKAMKAKNEQEKRSAAATKAKTKDKKKPRSKCKPQRKK